MWPLFSVGFWLDLRNNGSIPPKTKVVEVIVWSIYCQREFALIKLMIHSVPKQLFGFIWKIPNPAGGFWSKKSLTLGAGLVPRVETDRWCGDSRICTFSHPSMECTLLALLSKISLLEGKWFTFCLTHVFFLRSYPLFSVLFFVLSPFSAIPGGFFCCLLVMTMNAGDVWLVVCCSFLGRSGFNSGKKWDATEWSFTS